MNQTHDTPTEHCIIIAAQGTPRPQPRPRMAKGKVISTMDPHAKRWAASIESSGKRVVDNLGGVKVVKEILGAKPVERGKRKLKTPLEFRAVFRIPTKDESRWGGDHEQVPDTDNLAKLAMDALCRVGALGGDDGRVSRLTVVKLWCSPREAGAVFEIRRVIKAQEMPSAEPVA